MGYGFAVDWWSLGILGWETLAGSRPFPVHASTSHREALAMLCNNRPLEPPGRWPSGGVRDVIESLLAVEPLERCSSLKELKQLGPMAGLDFDGVLNKRIKPAFTPPKDHLNCDPTFELEEMIVETKPLHKKKKRLAKQRFAFTMPPPLLLRTLRTLPRLRSSKRCRSKIKLRVFAGRGHRRRLASRELKLYLFKL